MIPDNNKKHLGNCSDAHYSLQETWVLNSMERSNLPYLTKNCNL